MHLSESGKQCVNDKKGCCEDSDLSNKSSSCNLLNVILIRETQRIRWGFFSFKENKGTLNLENIDFYNFNAVSKLSGYFTLIIADLGNYNILLNYCSFNKTYFEEGFLASTISRSVGGRNAGKFNITFINSSIVNYNFYNNFEKLFKFYAVMELDYLFTCVYTNFYMEGVYIKNFQRFIFSENSNATLKKITITDLNFKSMYQPSYDSIIFSISSTFIFDEINISKANIQTAEFINFDYRNFIVVKNCVFSQISSFNLFRFSKSNNIIIEKSQFSQISNENETFFINILNKGVISSCSFEDINLKSGRFLLNLQSNTMKFERLTLINFHQIKKRSPGLFFFYTQNIIDLVAISVFNFCIEDFFLFSDDANNIKILSLELKSIESISSLFYFNRFNSIIVNASTFENIKISIGGVLEIQFKNSIFVLNSFIRNIETNNLGGVIKANETNNLYVTETTITKIKNTKSGGAFYLDIFNLLEIRNSTFTFISGQDKGGVIFIGFKNTIEIQYSTFSFLKNNKVSGGIVFCQDDNKIKIENSFFWKNGGSEGGLFNFQKYNFVLINKTEFQSSTGYLGGVSFAYDSNKIFVKDSIFFQNRASNLGGAFVIVNYNYLSIFGSKILDSESEVGGCIYVNQNNTMNIYDSNLFNSYAKIQAGSIFINTNNQVDLRSIKLRNASSDQESGCFYGYITNAILIFDCEFYNISSVLRGGGIFLYFRNALKLSNSVFIDSKANLKGGCLYASISNNIELEYLIVESSQNTNIQEISIYILNNNHFSINNIKFKGKLGIHISQYNNGSLAGCSVLPQKNLINPEIKTITNQAKDIDIDLNSNVFLLVLSSFLKVINLEFHFQKNIGFLEVIASEVIFQNISIKKNEIEETYGNYLIISEASQLKFFKCDFLDNDAKLFKSNKSEISFKKYTIQNTHLKYFLFELYESLFSISQGSIIKLKNTKFCRTAIYSIHSDLLISKTEFVNHYGNEGGAIFSLNTNLKINYCLFILNKALDSGGAIFFVVNSSSLINIELKISKSSFFENKAKINGGAIFYLKDHPSKTNKLKFNYLKFFRNMALDKGGSCFISKYEYLFINRINLMKNSAQTGGSLYLLAQKNVSLLFRKLFFSNNSAIAGGAIFFDNKNILINESSFKNQTNKIYFSDIVFSNNIAFLYGSDKASIIDKISFLSAYETFSSFLTLSNLQSGGNYSCPYSIIAFDSFDNLIFSDQDFFPSLFILPYQKEENKLIITRTNLGILCGDSKLLIYPRLSSIFKFAITVNTLSSPPPIFLSFYFRNCEIGEYRTPTLECLECPKDSYSLKIDATSCEACSPLKFFCYGGSKLTPRPGFWRNDFHSENFFLCPNQKSCLGYFYKNPVYYHTSKAIGQCEIGYKGVLCAECAEGYGAADKFFCTPCDDEWIVFYVIGTFILKIVIILFSVHTALIMGLSLLTSNTVNLRKVISNILMKILFNHLQCLIIVFSIRSLILPELIKTIFYFSKVSSPSVTDLMSLECGLKTLNLNFKQHIIKITVIWVTPVILVIISFFYLNFYLKNKKKKYVIENKRDRIRIWYSICLTVFMILYPDCLRVCLETFNCLDVGYPGNPSHHLITDYSITCWDETHKNLIYGATLPFIIIIVIGFPVYLLYRLIAHWRNNTLNDKKELLKYGYFYFGYDKQYFYWDLVILLRKIFVLSIDVFFLTTLDSQTINKPVLAMFFVLFVSLYLQMSCSPYRRDKLDLINSLETKSLIALVGTVYVGLLNMEVVFGEENYTISFILFGIVLVINVNFIVFWFLAFYKYIISQSLSKFKIKLISCFIASYNFIKRLFFTRTSSTIAKDRWEMFDKYTIELKKRTRKMETNMQESLIEEIRRSSNSSNKNLKRKSTICINQPSRYQCTNCETTMKIEEENKILRDELFTLREKVDSKENYIKELIIKLNMMKTLRIDRKDGKRSIEEIKEIESVTNLYTERKKEKSEIQIMKHFVLIKCLFNRVSLLSKNNYEIYARVFMYASKDITKEYFLNFIISYEFTRDMDEISINYEYEKSKISFLKVILWFGNFFFFRYDLH